MNRKEIEKELKKAITKRDYAIESLKLDNELITELEQRLSDMKTKHGWGRVKDGERYYHIIETDKGFEVYSRREGRYAVDENGFNNNNYNTNEDTLCGVSDIFNMIMAEVKKWEVEKNKLMHYESLKNRIKTLGVWGVK
jgi:chromosome segregation ATPase